jgi:hypothetical protein
MWIFSKRKKSHIVQLTKKSQFAYKLKTPFDYTILFNGEFGGTNSDVKGSMCKNVWLT